MGQEIKLEAFYENLIIGGGIVGAGILDNFTKQGSSSLLIGKLEHMSQTSSKSSKMLHGGIRYLENLEFDLVKEALYEKNFWLKAKPHLATQKEFFIPVYKHSPHSLIKLSLGVKLYDLLSGFKNLSSGTLSKKSTLKKFPQLNPKGLKGSVSYSDAIIDDKELGLEIIQEALSQSPKSQSLEQSEILKYSRCENTKLYTVTLQTPFGVKKVQVKNMVFSTGPFTDNVMKALGINWKPKIVYSKGSHLFLKKSSFELTSPIVIQDKNRIIFLIPHEEFYLCGTTEIKVSRSTDLFKEKMSLEEKNYLLKNIKDYFPNIDLKDEDIIKSTAGIRPLVSLNSEVISPNAGSLSRHHQIFIPEDNMFVIIGGKYTTFRVMAQDLVKLVCKNNNLTYKNVI